MYSCSMAILLVFLSDSMLTAIKHVHIGFIVHHMGCELFNQGGILPFINSIESDLKEVRELLAQGKEVSWAWSYSCLMANYRGIITLPTDPPYHLMYPTAYDDHTMNKTHFNTMGCPSGMFTETCVCCSLLHLMDIDSANRQKFKGSCLLVPCSTQYKTLFPIIDESLHTHHWPLMDLNTGKPYLMEAVGNFCLEDAFLPGCPGDHLMFCTSELTELAGQGYHIPTYQEKTTESIGSSKTHQSPHPKENSQKPPCKDEESSKPSSRTSGTSSPWVLDYTSTSKTSNKSKLSPPSKNEGVSTTRRSIHLSQESRKTSATARTTMSPTSPRSHPTVRKTTNRALTRTVAALPIKGATSITLLHVLPHSSAVRKRPASSAQPTPQVKAHELGT